LKKRLQAVARHLARRETWLAVRRLAKKVATALDLAHDGKQVGSADTGKGGRHHRVQSDPRASLRAGRRQRDTIDHQRWRRGKLDVLGSVAVADDRAALSRTMLVIALRVHPKQGALLVVTDPFQATK